LKNDIRWENGGNMEGIFDSHAHYFDARFERETDGADAVLQEVFAGGIGTIINVATNMGNVDRCLDQARRYPGMYAAVGIHPEDAQQLQLDPDGTLAELEQLLANRDKHKIVALGEIGFDYHYEPVNYELQTVFFERQMQLAKKFQLPVIIHDREAHGDCFDMICRFPEVKGVFHSYSGSAEMARELVRRGWYISFSGVVTFKNAERVRHVAATIPTDRLLVETDCPYLAPHPNRGKINRSDYLHYTISTLAELFAMTSEEMISLTRRNAELMFRL
jgi:TatD DNase family protein